MTRARIDCPTCGSPLALEHFRASKGELFCFSCLDCVETPEDVRLAAEELLGGLPKERYDGPPCADCGKPANPVLWVGCADGFTRDLCEECAQARQLDQ